MLTHLKTRTATALLSLTLLAAGGIASAQNYYGPPQPRYENQWEAPPPQFAIADQRSLLHLRQMASWP